MKLAFITIACVALLTCGAHASGADTVAIATALANDNRLPAGELKRGTLTVSLDLVEATWYPAQERGPSLHVYAFAEPGRAPQIPGPLIRVPQGTEVRASIHNTLPAAMFVRGLNAHDSVDSQPIRIAPNETVQVSFVASSTGSYYYSARSTKQTIREVGLLSIVEDLPMGEPPFEIESPLSGAFIVDPPGSHSDDRIFVIIVWMKGVINPPFREVATINGKAWPYTERLSYRTGDAAHWRVLNTSLSDHAMHLHGFFFRVDSLGDGQSDHRYSPEEAPHAVTQYLPPGSTASLTWTPERAGRWIFHCHMTAHMSPNLGLVADSGDSIAHSAPHDPDALGMGGLILGINVAPGQPSPSAAGAPATKARQLHLFVRDKPGTRFTPPRMGYMIQEAGEKENSDPPPVPGKPLVLTRGEPVELLVTNQLKEETAVHWHGIELESFYDGVPGWGGQSQQTTPSIPPGGSFLARMTPPRAGTFIYHTHWHDIAQLTSGLYGPLIVLEPGEKFDPAVDLIFLISRAGPDDENPVLLNGSPQPPAIALKGGRKYRFRFINIATDDSDITVSLLQGANPVQWRALAKDGWNFSPSMATVQLARQPITVGETRDFEFMADHPGELTLEVAEAFLKIKLSQSVTIK